MTQIFIFGDSVAYGAWDESGGWVQRIRLQVDRRNLEDEDYWGLVYNLGVSGDTAEDVLRRFENELTSRRGSDEAEDEIILFAVGINDSTYLVKDQCIRFTEVQFRQNLVSLVEVAKRYTNKIGLVGLYPIDQNLVDPIPWAPEKAYRNSLVSQFDAIIRDVGINYGFTFINLMGLWDEKTASEFVLDGVHPNAEGHKRIAEEVVKFLEAQNVL